MHCQKQLEKSQELFIALQIIVRAFMLLRFRVDIGVSGCRSRIVVGRLLALSSSLGFSDGSHFQDQRWEENKVSVVDVRLALGTRDATGASLVQSDLTR